MRKENSHCCSQDHPISGAKKEPGLMSIYLSRHLTHFPKYIIYDALQRFKTDKTDVHTGYWRVLN